MSTLLVDNYDSYTYNVFHLLAAVSGEEPIVVHNDAISWTALSRWDFDAIVLSPGPGRPQRWHDFGVCADILRHSEIPVLGICLGHQGIGNLLSGMVGAAPEPMHGRLSRVQHENRGLFAGSAAGLLCRALPLARRDRLARSGGARDGVDRRRRRDGHRTSPPAVVGRAVPPRVDRDRARHGGSSRTSTTGSVIARVRSRAAPGRDRPRRRSRTQARRTTRR